MVRSMTGFGKATCEYAGGTISIELSSVNHRYLDSNIRLPGEWSSLDPVLREALKERLSRGKINVSISRKRAGGDAQKIRLDREVAEQYIQISKELSGLLDSEEPLSLQTLAQFENVFSYEEDEEDLEESKEMLLKLLGDAVSHLDTMRETEGGALGRDIIHRIGLIRESVEAIEMRLPALNELFAERLRARIEVLGQDTDLTEERIAIEVAIMAEKGDVTEEIVRLNSHLDHAEELLGSTEPVGRQLNFLSQEVQREINTLSSKVRDPDVIRQVLQMKSELERIREQIQNIE
ncbi:MAG: YicC/YloC family endoribonuclease [Candidatus Hydrogenedentes bacterium]|nr:YicC/YloC family endoribonuclease [Candidatus Hydrogenedentota bacterium]